MTVRPTVFVHGIKRFSPVATVFMVASCLVGLAGQAPAAAVTAVSVTGSACGYYSNVGLFGGPQAKLGCAPQSGTASAPATASTLSPSVALPPSGSSTPITATDADGAAAKYGPSTIVGGEWPDNVAAAPPTGPISVSTQGTPAGVNAGGAVTSSADISLYPTPIPVGCATGFSPPCTAPGGFGPFPVQGDSLHVECSATQNGVSGSVTFVNATLATSTDTDGGPRDSEKVPDNPPVNYTRSGVITNVGDVFTVVYNEQIVNADGSLTVNAAHMYLFGPTAVGDVVKGQATCGTTPSAVTPADRIAPTCGIRVVEPNSPEDPTPKVPRTELVGVFDAGGLQSITNIQATNGTVQLGIPSSSFPYLKFTAGQTGPLAITATRTDESKPMTWSFDATDVAGNVTHCAPPLHPAADFDGNGTTDISVFRPSTGQWFNHNGTSTFFGINGDIPVPCDYDGNGATDIAIFRPSVGGWYNQSGTTVFFGLNGDIPVPGDYNGDGKCDIAVFRPSVGGWYIQGQPTVFYGLNGDIPVPNDYDGNGSTDVAVFRPSVGGWYRNGAPTVFFGLNGDIPVPNDYDGNGTADTAIFRPSVGGWYVPGRSVQFLGISSDIPVPGIYHANGDVGVFRPATGAWFIQGQDPVFFGTTGDIPLPLPAAIRTAFFS
jgi:hypothetical protein